MKKVVFLHGVAPEVVRIVESMSPPGFIVEGVSRAASESEKIEAVRSADFLILHPASGISPAMWEAARKVKLIQTMAAGVDKLDLGAAARLGIPVANNGGANAIAVSEHTILLMLAVYKRLKHSIDNMRSNKWREGLDGLNVFEMAGKTVGIVGLGNIGTMVARRLRGFDTNLQYFDVRRQKPEVERELDVHFVPLDDLLCTSDIVSLHAPLDKGTKGLIGERELGLMKRSAVLINCARGELVDQPALIAALRQGTIAGAGLDVLVDEPADPANPLPQMDNVVVTPHRAGSSYETWFHHTENCFANVQRVAKGEAPLWVMQAAATE